MVTKMPKIRILLFCSSLNIGGTERNVVNIAKQLDKSRFDVQVYPYYYGGPLEKELKSHNIPYTIGGLENFLSNIKVHWNFIKFVKREKPEIIHCFNYPTIYIGILLGRLANISKVIVAIQAWDTWKGKSQILLDRMIRPFVDLYISDSKGARRFAINQQKLDPDKIITLHDGVDTLSLKPDKDGFQLRKEIGISNNYTIVGVVARLQDNHKGQSYFIKAIPLILKEFPDTNFLIVGDGADRAYLESVAKKIGVKDKVFFAGFRTDLANMFSIIDILVIPSIQWESITKTMLEAMAMARPIVATNVGDVCEILEDGKSGILIPSGDSPEIARAVTYLLNNPDYARKIGNGGSKEIQKRGLTLEKSVKSLEDTYRQQLSIKVENGFVKKGLIIRLYYCVVFVFISLGYFVYRTIEGIYRRIVICKNSIS